MKMECKKQFFIFFNCLGFLRDAVCSPTVSLSHPEKSSKLFLFRCVIRACLLYDEIPSSEVRAKLMLLASGNVLSEEFS